MRFIFILVFIILLSGCYYFQGEDYEIPEGNLSILSANLLGTNTQKQEMTQSLLSQQCDIMVLVEARPDYNFVLNDIISAGYQDYFFESSMSGFNVFIASKITGTAFQIDNFTLDENFTNPINFLFGELRITIGDVNIVLLGVHMPSPFSFERANQDLIFNALVNLYPFEDGKLVENSGTEIISYPIICGDFNAFPHESYFTQFKAQGLVDTFVKNPDPYDYTWGFSGEPVLARIDYIFVSRDFSVLGQRSFDLPGSDHRGVKSSIDLPK